MIFYVWLCIGIVREIILINYENNIDLYFDNDYRVCLEIVGGKYFYEINCGKILFN